MATGVATLRGRFKPGTRVWLIKVADERVLRAEGGELIDDKVVDEQGCVQFSRGVDVGGRYFICGHLDGTPLEVRVRGNEPQEDNSHLVSTPVQPERQRLSDGSWQDEVVLPGTPRQVPDTEPVPEPVPEEKAAPKASKKSTTAKPARGSARKEK